MGNILAVTLMVHVLWKATSWEIMATEKNALLKGFHQQHFKNHSFSQMMHVET